MPTELPAEPSCSRSVERHADVASDRQHHLGRQYAPRPAFEVDPDPAAAGLPKSRDARHTLHLNQMLAPISSSTLAFPFAVAGEGDSAAAGRSRAETTWSAPASA